MKRGAKSAVPCLLSSWEQVENSLYHWLNKQTHDNELAFDVLQETFLRALQLNQSFCDIENHKAWLFRVASNLLVDEWRKQHRNEPLDIKDYADIEHEELEPLPVDSLAQCLPKALACLSADDRDVIEYCDLQGHSQLEFSQLRNLSISAVKSRVQRARVKLSTHLKTNCQIRFDENNRVCCFFPQSTQEN
jgi:RNA polymerase sigma-70 factor (ECF subfamily)